MEANLQRRIQRYGWDRAVPHYEAGWRDQLYPAQSLMLRMADLQAGERVVETACGTGLATIRAALAVGPAGSVVATDISDRMVAATRGLAGRWDLPQVACYRSDAEELRTPAGYFDAGLCALGLMYYPDPLRALQLMHHALRDGGRFAAAVWGERAACGWNAVFPIVDARVRTEVCPLFYQLGTGDTLRRAFEATGFVDVQSERIRTTLHYPTAEAALHAAFSGGPVAMAYARFDEATRAEVHAEYLRSIEQYQTQRGYEISGEFVVAVGYKS
jgi:ubiquinone/menaquinone biosynthesis C-methylase UbiE